MQLHSFERDNFFTGRPANCAEQHRPQTNDDIVCEQEDKEYLTWFTKYCKAWQNVLDFCFPSKKKKNNSSIALKRPKQPQTLPQKI